MIKAILFDLDNTLIDFFKMKRACVESGVDAMIDAGLKMNRSKAIKKMYEIYEKHNIEYQKVFDDFLKENIGKIDYKIMGAGIAEYRKTKQAYLKPYPHVLPTLTQLSKKGYKLCIVSDAPRLQVYIRLAALGLHHLFDLVVTHEDTRQYKDTGLPFHAVLKKLKLKPEECLMVGDWVDRDIVGAKKVGIKTVFAKYGDVWDVDIKDSKADYVIEDIGDILNILERK